MVTTKVALSHFCVKTDWKLRNMKDEQLKAIFVGIELEKAKYREDAKDSTAVQELRELEQAERTAKRLKSETAYALGKINLWDVIKESREHNKENKRIRQTFWYKLKKVFGLIK